MNMITTQRTAQLKALDLKTEAMGVTLLAVKPTTNIDDGFYIVLAVNERDEFVTWLWANGGFHQGHYFGDVGWENRRDAYADYESRSH